MPNLEPLVPPEPTQGENASGGASSQDRQRRASEERQWREFKQIVKAIDMRQAEAKAIAASQGANDDSTRSQVAAYVFIARSDQLCDKYLTEVSIARNGTVAALDIGSLALNAAGGATGTTNSANTWSNLAGLASGSRSVLEKEVLNGQQFGLIFDAVRTGREGLRAQLNQKIQAEDFDDWSTQAIAYYLEGTYHVNCGINYGLAQLRAGQTALKSQQHSGEGDPLDTNDAVTERLGDDTDDQEDGGEV